MNKKGEMTTEQIVMMIILIVSFGIILFFLAQLALGEETNAELCHNSVSVRGAGIAELADATPLNCKKEDVCISKDGSCENMYKPKIIETKDKIAVYKALAEEISACWWMFGEGKVNYVGKDLVSTLYCSLCDQVAFDDSVKEIFNGAEFDKKEFYYYMTLANYSEKQTYSEYLFGTNDLNVISNNVSYGKVKLDSQYFILTGMTSELSTLGWASVGAATAVVGVAYTVFTGGTGLVAGVIAFGTAGGTGAIAGGTGAYFLAPIVKDIFGNSRIQASLIEANSEEYNGLGCEDLTTKS